MVKQKNLNPLGTPAGESSEDAPAPPLPVHDYRSHLLLLRGHPEFRTFWLAGVISKLGDWFNFIGIFVLLTELTGSGKAVGWFLIAKFLPSSLFGPAAGVLADRVSRKRILVTADLARVFVVLCFLLVRRTEDVWLVYLLAFLQESLWTLADPARQASVPGLVGPSGLRLANALSGVTWSLLLAVGAGLGGLITARFGWRTAIVADALTFLASGLLLLRVRFPPMPVQEKLLGGWQAWTGIRDLLEGFRYILQHREVGPLLLVKSGWALSGGILVMLTYFGEQVFQTGGKGGGSGILYSARGMGAALGPILAWRFLGESKRSMYRAIGVAFFLSTAAYLLFSRAPDILRAAPCVVLGHMGGATQWVFSMTLLQQTVPDAFRGRVFAAEMALLTLVLSISSWLTGVALDRGLPPRTVVAVLALLFTVPGLLWTIHAIKMTRK